MTAEEILTAGARDVEKTAANQASPPAELGAKRYLPVDVTEQLCRDQAAEIERFREQLKELQAAQVIAQKRAAIAALLVEHGLPPLPPSPGITSESFIQSLLAAPDESAMRQLVCERAQLVEQARHSRGRVSPRRDCESRRDSPTWDQPLSREQSLIESRTDDSLEAFVKAIRA
jgi:hypothetical protein